MKKGFTLIELIVALTIALVVIGITAGIILSGTNIFAKMTERAQSEAVASATLDIIRSELRYSSEIVMTTAFTEKPPMGGGYGAFYTADTGGGPKQRGLLYFIRPDDASSMTGTNIFGESFYLGRTVAIRMKVYDQAPKAITVYVDVYDRNDVNVYTASDTFEVRNMQNTRPGKGDDSSGKETMISYRKGQ